MRVKRWVWILAASALLLGCVSGCAAPAADTPPEPEEEPTVDFIVDVESGRDPVVLQLSDLQIIDSAQMRTGDRLGPYAYAYWATDKMEDRCFKYVRETVNAVKPDLILVAGDNVYGEFDDNGTSWLAFIELMDSFGIPWAPVMGNHDTESKMGVDWQCEQLAKAEHCLFKQRELNGNGNYSVGVRQNDKITRVFFMMDTGSHTAGAETLANGHTGHFTGFKDDQIAWYTEAIARIREEENPDVKLSFMFHVPLDVFRMPAIEYGLREAAANTPFATINIDAHPDKKEGDIGTINHDFSGWDNAWSVWLGLVDLGVDSVFVGHEHAVSAGMTYQGVRLQFGQKSSTYDAANYRTDWGTTVFSYEDMGMPQVGGTVIPLSEQDGSLRQIYHYLCKEE